MFRQVGVPFGALYRIAFYIQRSSPERGIPSPFPNKTPLKRELARKGNLTRNVKQSGLQFRADKYETVGPGTVEGRTVQPLCCGIVKGDPIDGLGSMATGATSECHRVMKRISLCTRRKFSSKGASI